MQGESCKNCVTPCGFRDHPNSSVCSRYDCGLKYLPSSEDIVGGTYRGIPTLPKGSPPPPTPKYCWSSTIPTEEGFYWYKDDARKSIYNDPVIVYAFTTARGLYTSYLGYNEPMDTFDPAGLWQPVKPFSK